MDPQREAGETATRTPWIRNGVYNAVMENGILARNTTDLAREIMSDTPILVISGARQTGKSTLMQLLLQDNPSANIISLDDATLRESAQADPDGFVKQNSQGLLAIDEIQRVPQLLLSIKAELVRDRRPGRFLLTSSSNLHTLKGAEESLAGRAETLVLRGFSQGELLGRTEDFITQAWKITEDTSRLSMADDNLKKITRTQYLHTVFTPTFPEPYLREDRGRLRWFGNYIDRVLTSDAAQLGSIQYPDRLLPLLKLLAANPSGEYVAAHVARSIDIPERSVPAYLQALRDVFLVDVLPAWSNNLMKRVASKPKIMFRDASVAAYLARIDAQSAEHDISSAFTGGMVENFVAAELAKQQTWSQTRYDLFHFRDWQQREVDLIVEGPGRQIIGIEVKATTSVTQAHFKGLRFLQERLPKQFRCGIVLHLGTEIARFSPGLWAIPLGALWFNSSVTVVQ